MKALKEAGSGESDAQEATTRAVQAPGGADLRAWAELGKSNPRRM